jgi:ABC-type multidrug transport system ATPase subunit
MIRADNISHNYGDNKALDGFNLSVEQGEILWTHRSRCGR